MGRRIEWGEESSEGRRKADETDEVTAAQYSSWAAGRESLVEPDLPPLRPSPEAPPDECPVCRSREACSCEEADRTFVRRTRYLASVPWVARCPRCAGPLSPIYLPRRRAEGKRRLGEFAALWACATCQAGALARIFSALSKED